MNHNTISYTTKDHNLLAGICDGYSLPDFLDVIYNFSEDFYDYAHKQMDEEENVLNTEQGDILYQNPELSDMEEMFDEFFNEWYEFDSDCLCEKGFNRGEEVEDVENIEYSDLLRGFVSEFYLDNGVLKTNLTIECEPVEEVNGVIVPSEYFTFEDGLDFENELSVFRIIILEHNVTDWIDFVNDYMDEELYFATPGGLYKWNLPY